MLEPIGEVDLHADAFGMIACKLGECLLVARFASAKKNELRVERQKPRAEDQIEPFLIDHARTHAEHRNARIHRQAEQSLQRRFADGFAAQIIA